MVAEIEWADYGWKGIALIGALALARKTKHIREWQFVTLFLFFVKMDNPQMYWTIIFAFILIFLAETKKDLIKQDSFYGRIITSNAFTVACRIYYPLYLTVLAIIRYILY